MKTHRNTRYVTWPWIWVGLVGLLLIGSPERTASAQDPDSCGIQIGGWFLNGNRDRAREEVGNAVGHRQLAEKAAEGNNDTKVLDHQQKADKYWKNAEKLVRDFLTCNRETFDNHPKLNGIEQDYKKELNCIMRKVGYWNGDACETPATFSVIALPAGPTTGTPGENTGNRIPIMLGEECDSSTMDRMTLGDLIGCVPDDCNYLDGNCPKIACAEDEDCIGQKLYLVFDPPHPVENLCLVNQSEAFAAESFSYAYPGVFSGNSYLNECEQNEYLSNLLSVSPYSFVNQNGSSMLGRIQSLAIPLSTSTR